MPPHSRSPSVRTVARWTCWCRSCTRARQTPSCRSNPWPERTHHVTSENGWATKTTHLQLTATLDNVLNKNREGQAWILRRDMASIHASADALAATRITFPHVVLCFLPPHSTSYLQPCDVAVFRSFKSCIQTHASATLARSVIDGPFDDAAMNKAWRRLSSADWAARAVTDLWDKKPGVDDWLASLACPQRCPLERSRRRGHAHDGPFSMQIEPEPWCISGWCRLRCRGTCSRESADDKLCALLFWVLTLLILGWMCCPPFLEPCFFLSHFDMVAME